DQNAAAFTWEPASQATTLQTAQNIETGLASIPSTYLQQSFTVPTSGFLYQASFELQFTPACSQTEWFEIQLWQGTTMLADSASDAITPWIVGTHSPWGLPATFTRAVPLNPGVTYALRLLPSARMCANEKVSLMDSLSGGTANLAGHCVSKDPTTGLMNDVGQYCGLLVSLHDTTINQAASKWWPPSIPSTDVRAPGPAQTLPTSYAGPNGLNTRYAGFKVTTTSRVDRIDLSITGCAGLTQGAWTLYATDSSGQPTTPIATSSPLTLQSDGFASLVFDPPPTLSSANTYALKIGGTNTATCTYGTDTTGGAATWANYYVITHPCADNTCGWTKDGNTGFYLNLWSSTYAPDAYLTSNPLTTPNDANSYQVTPVVFNTNGCLFCQLDM